MNRSAILLGQFVFDYGAALHHELDPFEFVDVFERIAGDCDQVGEFTGQEYRAMESAVEGVKPKPSRLKSVLQTLSPDRLSDNETAQ